MLRTRFFGLGLPTILLALAALPAGAQSFRVQCPTSTITHPSSLQDTSSEPAYRGPSALSPDATGQYLVPTGNPNGAIKCQQISGGDGYSTMADGSQIYMFSFGPLSGLRNIANGIPATEFPKDFNQVFTPSGAGTLAPGFPVGSDLTSNATYNGAIGLVNNNVAHTFNIYDIAQTTTTPTACSAKSGLTGQCNIVTVILNAASPFNVGDAVVLGEGAQGTDMSAYVGSSPGGSATVTVTAVGINNAYLPSNYGFQYQVQAAAAALPHVNSSSDATASSAPALDGHVDARQIMDVAVMNGNIPAPLMAIDEDDEFFLTLTNTGMIMRPDLFEQHTVHFHGYPNASAFYDGVPDASVAIEIGGSFTYYYLAPDAGTYFYHCHISPPEHLQMGMVGQLYVRPRQNRWFGPLNAGLLAQQGDLRTACNASDLLCSNSMPAKTTNVSNDGTQKYVYNDGDGSTVYDVDYPLQMHGFDPNFHFVGMTFNPEGFADMKDKYFLLNGRSYPDTVAAGPMQTPSSDGVNHFSQPLSSIINIPVGGRALLRISELNVSEYHTLASLGIRMHVVGWNAKLLRDQAGNNMDYYTNSITLGGGESADVILDASDTTTYTKGQVFYVYTSNLDHLSNDAENFGGQMTEVHICSSVDPNTKACTI